MKTEEKVRHIERREVQSYQEEYVEGMWRAWRCEVKVEPHDNYSEDWYFWFTLPSKEEDDGEVIGAEIYFSYGHRLYVRAAEIVYDEVGEEIARRPLFTDMDNMRSMVEHTQIIRQRFKNRYGL